MATLETIIQDIQQISPQHLEEVHQLVQTLKAREEANKKLTAQLHEIFSETDDLGEEAWADIGAYMKRLRAELFTRPNPFMEDADAT